MEDIEGEQSRGGHAEGQSGDIDRSMELVLDQVADGDLPVVFKHMGLSWPLLVFVKSQKDARLTTM